MYGYPDLYRYGWKPGVYRAPVGYEHPWLAVTPTGTSGHWTRQQARQAYRQELGDCQLVARPTVNPDAATTCG